MKNQLEAMDAVLGMVIQELPYLYSNKELMGGSTVGMDIKRFAASLEISSISTEIKHLDQFLDSEVKDIDNDKDVITVFKSNLQKNIDSYSQRLSYVAENMVSLDGEINLSKKILANIISNIITRSQVLIANAS